MASTDETHVTATQATALQRHPTFSGTQTRRSTTNNGAARSASVPTQISGPRSLRQSLRQATLSLSVHVMPEKKIGQPPPFLQGVKAIILGSCEYQTRIMSRTSSLNLRPGLNVLLLFIPVSVRLCFPWVANTFSSFTTYSGLAILLSPRVIAMIPLPSFVCMHEPLDEPH